MMRSAIRCGAALVALPVLVVGGFSGCTQRPVILDETTRTEVETQGGPAGATGGGFEALPASTGGLEIRELKIIDDNGQQGVFAKLSRPPTEVSHFTLGSPNRLVIEMRGQTPGSPSAQQYPVDNPMVAQVRVGSGEGKVKITLVLRGEQVPTYSVDDLNDTLVAFLGEPVGSSEPVHEQIVFTQRMIPGQPAPSMVAAAAPARSAAAEPSSPAPVIRVHEEPSREDRSNTFATDEAPRKLYYGQPVSLDLKDADIHNVVRLLAGVSNLNIIATDDVQGRVTLRLSDVPWDQAFDLILQVMGLESVEEGNVIRISTIRRLREEREELARAQDALRDVEPLKVVYLRINYAKAAKLAELIAGVGPLNQLRAGGRGNNRNQDQDEQGILSRRGSVFADEFTNTVVVRDIQGGIDRSMELVRRLDVQTPQIVIESKIIEATTDFARDLGVQWGYRSSIGPQTGTSTGANFPGSVNFGGTGLTPAASGAPFLFDFPAGGNFGPGAGTALDLALGSLDGSQSLDIRLTALEERGKGRVISRPRVVTLNNKAATIKSLTILRVRLPSTGTVINTGAGGNAGAQSQATEQIQTGIILTVVPQVSSDGYVLLDMFVKSSQADFSRTVDNIPTEIAREATSTVLVRDGQTIVLGGIYRDQISDNESGVPFFNQIPGLKWLFRAESKSKRREDLLVFITPRALNADRAFKDLPSAADLWENRDSDTALGEP